ncbi:MAG: NB-ARC domain-containing protein [Acidobacteriota bacterium]|nr:NB-ARC domain-containing protein [Acidobacteriota bacterium]
MRPPVSLTRLVGREPELRDIERLVSAQRLTTLTGVGGSGKTRLASEVALRLDWKRADSVAWVELAACSDPQLVPQQIAAVLALRNTAGCGTVAAIVEALRERELLLVLDNCEHVIDACAELTSTLLAQCPRLNVLATSREPLGVAGERVWPVPPIAANEAAELFVDRAAAVEPSFALTESNRDVVLEICRRLDGIPLAIELAAARVRVLTPEQILARLEDRFAILAGGARTAIARHRTLRATIDWSYALLTAREQTLLARLAVFSGSFALEQVEVVCSCPEIDASEMLDLLCSLVDKSLVVANRKTAVRYSLLETIREYASEKLAAMSDAVDVQRRHALAFLAIARDAAPEMMTGTVARFDRLDADHDNVRAALTWSLDHEPDAIALPLAAAFRWYWYYRILWSEGLRWMSRALERSSDALTTDRAGALTAAGTFSVFLGDLERGRGQLERAESMWRTLHAPRELALTLIPLAQTLATMGDLDAAEQRAAEGLAVARTDGSEWEVAYCLTNGAAFIAQRRGDFDAADRALEEAERIWTPTRHVLGLPLVLNARAVVALRRNDLRAAARFARAALNETRARSDGWFSARALRILAFTSPDPHRAARLLGAAGAMLRAMAAGMLLHEKGDHDRLVARLRESLGDDVFESALREGSGMTFDDACELALSGSDDTQSIDAASEPLLEVRDLGPLQITIGGKPLAQEARASGRARELLVYLLAHPQGRTKEEVGVAFWPDASADQVKNSFHVTLHRLRKLLGSSDAVTANGARYTITLPHAVASRRFESEMQSALRQREVAALESAVALYEGDFLQGEDAGEWCLPIRAHLRQLHLRGLYALGQLLESRGRYTDAADVYTRVTAREPFHEAAWRQLMICRARLGARSESLLLYRQLEQRLRDDLEASPEPETALLYRRLQQNESV